MQTDIVELEKAHPEYAAEFEGLHKEINKPVDSDISATQSTAIRDGQATRLYDAGKEFDKLVKKIRQLPNFDTFLQAPGLDKIQDITDRGPIIIFNVSIIHCDAKQELEVVKDVCTSIGLEVEPEQRKAALIDQLRQCKFFHFACHGCTGPQDPLRSYLCHEKSIAGRWSTRLQSKRPTAFPSLPLSLWNGHIQQEQFMDESVHLISAFQLAGFQHVIGTLWEVNDRAYVDIATVVYEAIKDGLKRLP
ncbi:hypothetical protein Forpe1208_v008069 [Fusarium oxysporum f. sp. rapae]|uniref:CHAT domain-containing protein n=1 Tax=Fusarium oxysporum f. sp. rapae TaxID=485398 RepID=A0A8J5P8F9_FUSOX|nr:hypothetical protein Forpe1208_v008069 [Fusarium oxysporum f. sp. rapae]